MATERAAGRIKAGARAAITAVALVFALLGLFLLPAFYYAADNFGLDSPYLSTKISMDGGFVHFVFRADTALLAGNPG